MEKIRVMVWNEFVHEQKPGEVRDLYPDGIHVALADGLKEAPDFEVKTAVMQEPEHGLTEEVLANTDVLFWWGHLAQPQVDDKIAERVQQRVLEGMGLIALHSGQGSKPVRRLLGTMGSLRWREAAERERLWVCNPGHPITQGLGEYVEIEKSEMYGEPFDIPPPHEQIFISWFEGGEVFRSGNTWMRGNGKLFTFSTGHETYPIYYQDEIKLILKNAARWARPQGHWKHTVPEIKIDQAPEKIGLR